MLNCAALFDERCEFCVDVANSCDVEPVIHASYPLLEHQRKL